MREQLIEILNRSLHMDFAKEYINEINTGRGGHIYTVKEMSERLVDFILSELKPNWEGGAVSVIVDHGDWENKKIFDTGFPTKKIRVFIEEED